MGDIVKARFPVIGDPAGALGGNSDAEIGDILKVFHHLFDEVIAGAAVDGDAAEGVHQRAQRPTEKRIFANPAKIQIADGAENQGGHEVPPRGVVGADDDAFFWWGLLDVHFPVGEFGEGEAHALGEGVFHGSFEVTDLSGY